MSGDYDGAFALRAGRSTLAVAQSPAALGSPAVPLTGVVGRRRSATARRGSSAGSLPGVVGAAVAGALAGVASAVLDRSCPRSSPGVASAVLWLPSTAAVGAAVARPELRAAVVRPGLSRRRYRCPGSPRSCHRLGCRRSCRGFRCCHHRACRRSYRDSGVAATGRAVGIAGAPGVAATGRAVGVAGAPGVAATAGCRGVTGVLVRVAGTGGSDRVATARSPGACGDAVIGGRLSTAGWARRPDRCCAGSRARWRPCTRARSVRQPRRRRSSRPPWTRR